jgi:SAM-dependent methyltransferase
MGIRKYRLYEDLAWTWPIISPPEEYAEEAEQFSSAILKYSKIPVKTLLDLGCGGGHNDFHLKRRFAVTGVDISDCMLENARRLNPKVRYLSGDILALSLGETFDSVMIADSIIYMLDEEELESAFRTAYQYLKPGGVFCTYAEEWPEKFVQNDIHILESNKDDISIIFVGINYDPDIADTTFESHFVLIIREGGTLRVEEDKHICGIFPLATWERLLNVVGFAVHWEEFEDTEVHPFFVCVKPP